LSFLHEIVDEVFRREPARSVFAQRTERQLSFESAVHR